MSFQNQDQTEFVNWKKSAFSINSFFTIDPEFQLRETLKIESGNQLKWFMWLNEHLVNLKLQSNFENPILYDLRAAKLPMQKLFKMMLLKLYNSPLISTQKWEVYPQIRVFPKWARFDYDPIKNANFGRGWKFWDSPPQFVVKSSWGEWAAGNCNCFLFIQFEFKVNYVALIQILKAKREATKANEIGGSLFSWHGLFVGVPETKGKTKGGLV